LELEGELQVVEAEEVEDRGVEVVDLSSLVASTSNSSLFPARS
jgi:hypothetical protein